MLGKANDLQPEQGGKIVLEGFSKPSENSVPPDVRKKRFSAVYAAALATLASVGYAPVIDNAERQYKKFELASHD